MQHHSDDPVDDYDVLVVGQGPVGQVTAGLLAVRGYSVLVIEKYRQPYRRPRAVHLVAETLRTIDPLGAAEDWPRFAEPGRGPGEFLDADHDLLVRMPMIPAMPQGWPADLSLSQPDLEDVLLEHTAELPTLSSVMDAEVVAVDAGSDSVTVHLRGSSGQERRARGRYLVACDGANSFIRGARAIPIVDTGFAADWLVVDLRPLHASSWDQGVFTTEAQVTQVCDPARPTTFVASGPARQRFEFMRMPGDDVATLATAESVWSLLEPFGYTASNSVLEKNALYTFRARWAERWVDHHVLLAGDAAHQMPPMGGVGLVSGVRDAANLAWKLHLVLSGVSGEALLDTYWTERSAHVQHAITMSVDFGRLVCMTDRVATAARDAMLRTAGLSALPVPPPERLGDGVQPPVELAHPWFDGTVGPQARLRLEDGTEQLADRVAAGGFTFLFDGSRIDESAARRVMETVPAGLDVKALLITTERQPGVAAGALLSAVDIEGVYSARFGETSAVLEILRPDGYVYGIATDPDAARRLAG